MSELWQQIIFAFFLVGIIAKVVAEIIIRVCGI